MNIFIHDDYKEFVTAILDGSSSYGGRGGRKRLAVALNSHLPYITQVLKGEAEFSLEQAQSLCDYFHLSENESEYFMTLVEIARSSNSRLKSRYKKRIEKLKSQSRILSDRLDKTSNLDTEKETHLEKYYSSWLHGAVHAGFSIPKYESSPALLAKDLGISIKVLNRVIDDLMREGIILSDESLNVRLTNKSLHLRSESRKIVQHHLNWRTKCSELIQRGDVDGVNYSSVISVSIKDAEKLQEKIIEFIKECKIIIKDSREENICTFCLDFMRIGPPLS